jgi:hypothetical protein
VTPKSLVIDNRLEHTKVSEVSEQILSKVRMRMTLTNHLKTELSGLARQLLPHEKDMLLAPLAVALQSPFPDERNKAIYILGLFGPDARDAVPQLVKNLRLSVVGNVIEALQKICGGDALLELTKGIPEADWQAAPVIFGLLREKEPTSHLKFITPYIGAGPVSQWLQKYGPGAIPAILDEVRRQDAKDKEGASRCAEAANILSAYGTAATEPVVKALEWSAGDTRLAMLKMIHWLKAPALSIEFAPLLCRILVDELEWTYDSPARAAKDVLQRLGTQATSIVCDAYTDAPSHAYARLFSVLISFDHAVIPILKKRLKHENPIVRAHTAAALLKVTNGDDDDAVQTFIAVLSDHQEVAVDALILGSTPCFEGDPTWSLADPLREALKGTGVTNEKIDRLLALKRPRTDIPSHSVLKETLERDFAQEIEVGWGDEPPQMVRAEVDFQANCLTNPLTECDIGHPSFFKAHKIIIVYLRRYVFKPKSDAHPVGLVLNSHGRDEVFYVYDGKQLLDINGPDAAKNVGIVLRNELIDPGALDPTELARFLAHTLLPRHSVMDGPKIVLDGPNEGPTVRSSNGSGWTVTFWTRQHLGGCRGPKEPIVAKHTITISPTFEITHR